MSALAGKIPEAKHIADDVSDNRYKCWILQSIAAAYSEIGADKEAEQTLLAARDKCRRISEKHQRDSQYADIAIALALARSASVAEETAAAITEVDAKDMAMLAICKELSAVDIVTWARHTANRITSKFYRDQALSYVCDAETRNGDYQQASQLIDSMSDAGYRDYEIREIVKRQAKLGDIASAIVTARRMKTAMQRVYALALIAEAQTKSGNTKDSDATMKNVVIAANGDASLLQYIATTLTRLHDYVSAFRVLEQVQDSKVRWFAIRDTMKAQLADGDTVASVRSADSIVDPDIRADMLVLIANALLTKVSE